MSGPATSRYGLAGSGPRIVTWIAFAGAAVGLVVGPASSGGWLIRERHGRAALAAALFVLPVAVHGFRALDAARDAATRSALARAACSELKQVPPRAVIIAPPQISYRLLAAAPVYVVAAPPVHVAEHQGQSALRAGEGRSSEWLAHRAPGVARRYGATWAVRKGRLFRLRIAARRADPRPPARSARRSRATPSRPATAR